MDEPRESDGFGALLRGHRLEAGLTQQALAERAGLSARGIQDLERGLSRPYRDTLQRLVRALALAPEGCAAFEAAATFTPRRRQGGRPPSYRRVPIPAENGQSAGDLRVSRPTNL